MKVLSESGNTSLNQDKLSVFVGEDIHFSEHIMEKLPKCFLLLQSSPRNGIKFKNFNTTSLVALSL